MDKTIKKITLLIIVNFLIFSFLYADSDIDKKYRIFSNWQIDDGLPQNTVLTVIQDKKGYILTGTAEGLASFDGVRFQKLETENKSLNSGSIRALFKDDDRLWIGGKGLVKEVDGKIISVKTSENSVTDLVRTIFKDSSGRVYVGTYDNGLKVLNKGKVEHFSRKRGFISNTVHSVTQDSSNRVIVGTSKGICFFKDGVCSKNNIEKTLSGQIIRVIFEDSSGDLWVGTQTNGIYYFNKGVFRNYSKKNGLSHNWISSIIENEDGDIIVGTFGGGVNVITNGKIHHYGLKDGLSDIKITSLEIDHENNIWAGTWQGGLNQFRKARFFNQTAQNRLDNRLPSVIFEDSGKNLWVGTRDGGVFLFTENKFERQFTTEDGLSTNIINTIFETPDGKVAVSCDNGEKQGGLHVYNGKSFDPYLEEINTGDVSVVLQDKKGVLWVGTYRNGLYSIDKGIITTHYKNEFSGKVIRTMLVDHKNRLWIGTSGKNAALVMLEEGDFFYYDSEDGLSANIILSIYEDRERNLWLGSNGGGLILNKNGKFYNFTQKEGLFDNKVFSILEDSSENLWMSSHNGIFKVSKSSIYKYLSSPEIVIESKSYGVHDGMRTRECNGGFFPSAVSASDGHFIFPTIKGVVFVDPDNEIVNKAIPHVHIESLKINGVRFFKNIFDPSTERIEFKYTALSFKVPERVRFKYMLEGIDSTWIDAGKRRTAYYTNLPSGSFTFKVIAANNDGIWNKQGASFSFKITPYFYETLWFKLLLLILLIIIVWAIIRFRTYHIANQKKKLEELVLEKAQELNAAQEELVDVNSELKEKYRTSTLDGEIAQEYVKDLTEFMEREKPYLDEDLTLGKLAQLLEMSSHHLSQIINGELNQNFYTFLNTYRANEVREELKKEENRDENILILAYKAGFKTKSSFNIIFKKINGVTPTEFRKRHFNL